MIHPILGMSFPPLIGEDRGIALLDRHASIRAMIEQILFTMPGERVNRPRFGIGIQAKVFEPHSPFLGARLKIDLEDNLYDHISERVRILELDVTRDEARLVIRIVYEVLGIIDGQREIVLDAPGDIP